MSRPALAAWLLLCTPAALFAQADQKPPGAPQDANAAYKSLQDDMTKAIQAWRTEAQKAVQAAQEKGEDMPAIAMRPPTKEFIARAQELAEQWQGKPEAVQFLGFVIGRASDEQNAVRKAIRTLASDHAESAQIADVLPMLEYAGRFGDEATVSKLLDTVIEKNQDTACQAKALIVRGSMRLAAAETDEARALASADLKRVASVTKDAELLAQAKGALFEIENLQVGCTAPEIAAKDVEGVDFKLSDYRGKVVLLDFWGFW